MLFDHAFGSVSRDPQLHPEMCQCAISEHFAIVARGQVITLNNSNKHADLFVVLYDLIIIHAECQKDMAVSVLAGVEVFKVDACMPRPLVGFHLLS